MGDDVSRFEFDTQAERFDARTRLGEGAAREIASAVLEVAGVTEPRLLEVGAGTGEIGEHFCRSCRYVGIDLSAAMLKELERRVSGITAPAAPTLLVADANEPWPVPDGSVDVVFFSRVFHLLDPAHVARELERVRGSRGLTVLVGRTQRDRASVGARLRRQLLEALEDRGLSPKRGERGGGPLFDDLGARGRRIERREVATIVVERSARERLESWRTKGGLAGLDLPAEERDAVLAEVEAWARRRWHDLEAKEASIEAYTLEGAWF
ncbi:MAG: methyltransferase domain-containing protein [Polyangiaceae bacterium]|nr:methyltransferase domain-containing protein [Polyangiaceae bacterium]